MVQNLRPGKMAGFEQQPEHGNFAELVPEPGSFIVLGPRLFRGELFLGIHGKGEEAAFSPNTATRSGCSPYSPLVELGLFSTLGYKLITFSSYRRTPHGFHTILLP